MVAVVAVGLGASADHHTQTLNCDRHWVVGAYVVAARFDSLPEAPADLRNDKTEVQRSIARCLVVLAHCPDVHAHTCQRGFR